MSDVFISYGRENEATVQRVNHGATAAGYGIWWDAHLRAIITPLVLEENAS